MEYLSFPISIGSITASILSVTILLASMNLISDIMVENNIILQLKEEADHFLKELLKDISETSHSGHNFLYGDWRDRLNETQNAILLDSYVSATIIIESLKSILIERNILGNIAECHDRYSKVTFAFVIEDSKSTLLKISVMVGI